MRSSAELMRGSAVPQRWQVHRTAATTCQPLPTSSATLQGSQAETPPPPPPPEEERSEKEKTPTKGKKKARERSIEKEKGEEGQTGAEERTTKTSKTSSSSAASAAAEEEETETSKTPQEEEGKTTKTGEAMVWPLEKLPVHLRGRLHWHLLRTGATSRQLRVSSVQGGSVVYRDRGRQWICVYVVVIVSTL